MSNMSFKLSDKVKEMKPSGIRKFFDIVQTMKGVISLGVGEPDFATPWNIRESAFYSLEKGYTHYTSNHGLLELRSEIGNYLKKYNLDYKENEIIITVGASEGIDIALRGIINPGDEVIIPEPLYVSYRPIAEMSGAKVVTIDSGKNQFVITAEDILSKITDKTKAVILCYPNNPTGAILPEEEARKIAKVIMDKKIFCITDEIYSELTYGVEHFSIASIEGMKDYCIYLNGFSKAFSMTGWRIGYLCAPKDIVDQIVKIHQYVIMCAPIMAQYGAIEGLKNGKKEVDKMRDSYDRRRRLIFNEFKEMGLDVFEPKGAFYIFPNVEKTGLTGEEFALKLLESKKVAVVPGTAFGEHFKYNIRCSYATSIEDIKEAAKRMREFIEELEKIKK